MEFVTLKGGVKMPILGFGTFQIEPSLTADICSQAIEIGYRSIDTAQAYFNEEGVGKAVNSAIKANKAKREDFFITTKLWISHANEKDCLKAFEASLKKLNLNYIDLYLIHQPFNDYYGAWKSMQKLKEQGLIKAIGISNFFGARFIDFCAFTDEIPALNQIEMHPFFTRDDELKNMREFGVIAQSWGSFAEGKNEIFNNEILKKIANKYNKSVAQIILRWLIQKGVVVIPKSITPSRIRENFEIFDFILDEIDIKLISTLNTNKSLFLDHNNDEIARFLINAHPKAIFNF